MVTKLWAFDVISKFLSWFESFSNACFFCETWTSLTFYSGSQSASCIYIYRQSSQFFQKCCYQIDFLISKDEAQQIDGISSAWILVCFQNFAVNFPAACNWSALHCFFCTVFLLYPVLFIFLFTVLGTKMHQLRFLILTRKCPMAG